MKIKLSIGIRRLLVTLLCFTICNASLAQTPSQKLVLRIGVEDINYTPVMNFTKGAKDGLLHHIVSDFAQQESLNLEFIPLPLSRFPFWFDENAIDIRLPDNARWKLSATENIHYSDPMITLCDTTVVLSENKHRPASQFSRLGLPIGFTPSSKWREQLDAGNIEIARDSSLRVLPQMLVKGFIDGIDVNIAIIQNELKGLGLSPDLVSVSSELSASPVRYQISTKYSTDILERFNRYIADNKQNFELWARENGIAIAPHCERFQSDASDS